jgi:hypothetical protein
MPPVPLGVVTGARPFPPCRKPTGSRTHLFPRLLFAVHWSGREPLSTVPESSRRAPGDPAGHESG